MITHKKKNVNAPRWINLVFCPFVDKKQFLDIMNEDNYAFKLLVLRMGAVGAEPHGK